MVLGEAEGAWMADQSFLVSQVCENWRMRKRYIFGIQCMYLEKAFARL